VENNLVKNNKFTFVHKKAAVKLFQEAELSIKECVTKRDDKFIVQLKRGYNKN
jgi:hypothetical protein